MEEMRLATEDKGFLHQQAWALLFYPASALVLVSFNPFLTLPSFSVICFPGSASKIFTADKYVCESFDLSIISLNKLGIKKYLAIENC